ncbi:MAG: hypothetical protein ACLUEK_13875 [Oscillospiraceae bacterium]
MIRFESDYLEGALPEVMDALVRTNLEQTRATARTRTGARGGADTRKVQGPDAAVHFLVAARRRT